MKRSGLERNNEGDEFKIYSWRGSLYRLDFRRNVYCHKRMVRIFSNRISNLLTKFMRSNLCVPCNDKENCAQVSPDALLLSLLATLRSVEYAAIGDKNVILRLSEIRKYVYQFCTFIKMGYVYYFLNRKPTPGEIINIQSSIKDRGFSGCAGFSDLVDKREKGLYPVMVMQI